MSYRKTKRYEKQLEICRRKVEVDGKLWKRCGLTQVLEGIRKATPRVTAV